MILDKILKDRKLQLAKEKNGYLGLNVPFLCAKYLENHPSPLPVYELFSKNKFSIIGEIKKGSPSKGIIKEDFDPLEIIDNYNKKNIAMVSVLTEENNFFGSNEYLKMVRKKTNLPLLRKDFIFDPFQIYQSLLLGADGLLLIASILSDEEIVTLHTLSTSLNLCNLIEVHNEIELDRILKLIKDKRIKNILLGINNRNLSTFKVSLENSYFLREKIRDFEIKENISIITISESGIKTLKEIERLKEAGFKGALIGESLMKNTLNLQGEQNLKICGVQSDKDVAIINKYQPKFAGFILSKSQRKVTLQRALRLMKSLKKNITPVIVLKNEPLSTILKILEHPEIKYLQLHGGENIEYLKALKSTRQDLNIIYNIQITDPTSFKIDAELLNYLDILLFDTYAQGQSGGLGLENDFDLLEKNLGQIEGYNKPYIISGGISLHNLNSLVSKFQPLAFDLATGSENAKWEKDEEKINELSKIIKRSNNHER